MFRVALILAALTFWTSAPLRADTLSARSVFEERQDSANPTVEAKILGMRQALVDRAQEKEARAHNVENWRSETETSVAGAGMRMIQALALCVGALLVGLHLFKKYNKTAGRAPSGRKMRVIERIAVSAKTSLVMLDVEGRTVVISVGPDHVSQVQTEATASRADDYSDPMEVLCREDFKATAA